MLFQGWCLNITVSEIIHFSSCNKIYLYKVKAPIAGRLRKCHSIFCINRSKCDAESRIAAIILMCHLDQKVLGLVTVWHSRSADFNCSFFCCVGRSVIDVLSDFQLDSLTFVEVTLQCVDLSLCVVSIFHKKKNVIDFAATSLH